MKKICTLLLAAGLVFGAATGASAIDFKAKGQWIVSFDMGGNGDFTAGGKGAKTGWGGKAEDQFNAQQRVRLQLEAVASENLSGTVHFEIGAQDWGNAGKGAALGADGNNVVKVKHAFIDWMIPQTDAKVRMGIQPLSLPSFATGSQIFNDDVAGVSASYKFTDEVAATMFWARPYNDNGTDRRGNRAGYMDNVDMFALAVPVTLDGVKVTPFGMLGFIGPNAFGSGNYDKNTYNPFSKLNNPAWGDTVAGMLPYGGSFKNKKISSYGTAWWAGLTADVTVFDPLRIAADFNYGSVNWSEDSSLNRAGWLVSGLVEYKMDWGIPGIVAWYASGDDDNPKNGSERMPVAGNNSTNNAFSNFAFNGQPYLGDRESIIGKSMVGTWGLGLRLKDVSFVEDLKHTLRVNYIGGTNSTKNLKKWDQALSIPGGASVTVPQYGAVYGADNLYMTTQDSAVELTLTNTYKIYDNLTMCLEGSYLATVLGKNRMGGRDGVTTRKDVRDPWNVNLTFMYSF